VGACADGLYPFGDDPETVEFDCAGDLPTFTQRLTRAARRHELATPTRRAIRDVFRRIDVNADGTIDSAEVANLNGTQVDPLPVDERRLGLPLYSDLEFLDGNTAVMMLVGAGYNMTCGFPPTPNAGCCEDVRIP
jgi:hypothetical protein